MEPRADDGDDMRTAMRAVLLAWPQWSPVLMTGTTQIVGAEHRQQQPAAMEPRADDGDDAGDPGVGEGVQNAAMEPRADDGDDQRGAAFRAINAECRNGAPC